MALAQCRHAATATIPATSARIGAARIHHERDPAIVAGDRECLHSTSTAGSPASAGRRITNRETHLPTTCRVLRTTTSASPSFGERMYANHLPSFESACVRIPFHVRRSFSVSCRPAAAGGVHLDTGAILSAPWGSVACGLVAAACVAGCPCCC